MDGHQQVEDWKKREKIIEIILFASVARCYFGKRKTIGDDKS